MKRTKSSFVCDQCDFKTKQKDTLKTHMTPIHEKVHFLCCNLCDFTTIEAKKLNCHFRTTHEENYKYACDQCDFKTKRKGTLDNHIKTMYKEIPRDLLLYFMRLHHKVNSLFRHERNAH